MRIGFLTHYFSPEVGAPQSRIDFLARVLAARGASVTVHTGFPHYPDGGVHSPYRNRPWTIEQRADGVRIVRSAVYPAANRGFVRRLADHSAFAVSAMSTAGLAPPMDVVIAETPPLFLAAAAVPYAAVKRAALIVNVADLWPQSAIELGVLRNRVAIRAAQRLERWIYKCADLITAPTEGIVSSLRCNEVSRDKVERVWPVVDIERFRTGGLPPEREPGTPLKLLYAGTLGLAQGLETLIEAAREAGPDVVSVSIAGDGAEAFELRRFASRCQAGNVTFLGRRPAAEVPELYRSHDAGTALLRDIPLFSRALPTKILEAMAAGRPLLLAGSGEAAALVERAGAGLAVPPGDTRALVAAIRQLHSDRDFAAACGQAGRAFVEQHCTADSAAGRWLELCAKACAEHPSRRAFWAL